MEEAPGFEEVAEGIELAGLAAAGFAAFAEKKLKRLD